MGTFYNYGIKGHFAKKCHKNKQDCKNKFKGFSHAITNKIKLLMTILFISIVCKDTWFIDSGTSQYKTYFRKKFFQPLKFLLSVTN